MCARNLPVTWELYHQLYWCPWKSDSRSYQGEYSRKTTLEGAWHWLKCSCGDGVTQSWIPELNITMTSTRKRLAWRQGRHSHQDICHAQQRSWRCLHSSSPTRCPKTQRRFPPALWKAPKPLPDRPWQTWRRPRRRKTWPVGGKAQNREVQVRNIHWRKHTTYCYGNHRTTRIFRRWRQRRIMTIPSCV